MQKCKRCMFDPWVRKIPWSRKWQLVPVFLLGKLHGQRSLVGYCPWGHKELDMTERLSTCACAHACACTHVCMHTHTLLDYRWALRRHSWALQGHMSYTCCHYCLLLATLKLGSLTCNPAKQWELEDGVQLSSLQLRTGHILSGLSFFSPQLWHVIRSQ